MNLKEAYRLLDIDPDADDDTLKRAYRRAMRRTHPDAGGSAEEFHSVKEAYTLIEDSRANGTAKSGTGASTASAKSSTYQYSPARSRQNEPTPAQVVGSQPHSALATQFSFGTTLEPTFFSGFSSVRKNAAVAEEFTASGLSNRIPRVLPAARLFNGLRIGRGKRIPHFLVAGHRAVLFVPVMVPDGRYRHRDGILTDPQGRVIRSADVGGLRKEAEQKWPELNTIAITAALTPALDSYRPAVTAADQATGQQLLSAANLATAIADATLFLASGPQHHLVDTDVLAKVSMALT